MTIPGACAHLSGFHSNVDWKFMSVPNNYSLKALKGFYPRGKVVGGSSSVNWLQYVRGNKEDYNLWEKQGNKGWSYEDVLPLFKKSENFNHYKESDSKYHSNSGLFEVGYPSKISDTIKAFIKSGEDLGFPKNDDYNGESQFGFFASQQCITKDGKRSTVSSFINPFLNERKNLHLSTVSHVTKVLFDGKKAIGVEILRENQYHKVYANKEVILSAGTIGSPHILLLSGVGPKEHLSEKGIKLISDLPVGKNLQDHLVLSIEYNTTYHGLRQDELETIPYYLRYLALRDNYLSSSPVQGTAFVNTNGSKSGIPDIQIHFLPAQMPCRTSANLFGYAPGFCVSENKDALGLIVVLLHGKSRGYVKLNSTNPLDHPIIDLNFLSHPEDKEVLLKGIRIAQKSVNSKAFDQYRGDLKVQGKCPHKPDSDEYWYWMIEHLGTHLFHGVSTCRMGIDENSVVDPTLKVKGVTNLRVADASIMPEITSGNTQAPAMMIGEKAAEIIKKEYKI